MNNEKEQKKEIKICLVDYIQIKGKIICETGLTIGTGDVFGIGGLDKKVIRTGRDNNPYIPGSSLKGKMRHLFELMSDKLIDKNEEVHSCFNPECEICRIFGAANNEPRNNNEREAIKKRGPTRLIVRDAHLVTDHQIAKDYHERNGKYTEIKPENVINRFSGIATPRHFERVPAGIAFHLDVVYRQFEIKEINGKSETSHCNKDTAKTDIQHILKALSYVHRDYLGASGSRGYGKVKFKLDEKETTDTAVDWINEEIDKRLPGVCWSHSTTDDD